MSRTCDGDCEIAPAYRYTTLLRCSTAEISYGLVVVYPVARYTDYSAIVRRHHIYIQDSSRLAA